MVKKFKKIESNWLVEPGLSLSDLKEGDIVEFEMSPRDDWNTSSKGVIHTTTVIFHEPGIPCVDFEFFDKYFWGSRYIRIEQLKRKHEKRKNNQRVATTDARA